MAVLGLREARLANARVEAEIADDLRSESKRRMPPDRRRERRRSVHVHAREPSSAAGWQASAAPARLARARGRGPHRGSRPGADRPRPRVARPRAASYRRASDGLGGRRDPLAAGGRGYAPEPTSFFARRAGAQQPLPAVDEPAQRPCLLVRAPHLLEEIRGEQPGQGAGVASIGLGLGAETNWSLRVLAPPRKRRPARSSARYTSRRSSDRAPGPPHPGSARTAQAPAVSSRPSPPSATSPPSAIAPRSGRGGCLPPVKRTCPPLVGDRSKGAADEATRPPTCSQHTRGGGHEQRRPRSHRFEISLPLPASRSAPVRDSILPERPERTFLPGRRLGVRARRSASSIGVGDRPPPRCYRHRVARFIESRFAKLKERCVWRHAFETLNEDREVIAAYIDRYDDQPHSGPGYRTPEEVQRSWTVPRSPLQ